MTIPNTPATWLALGLALGSSALMAQPQPPFDFGKREYESNCASCHGKDGKGNGPMVEFLQRSPPDLSQLVKKNQGVFPMSRLYEVVEGAKVPGHGSREMPIWGHEFRVQDAEYYLEARGHYDPQALVRARILSLLEYINRLQVR